MLALVLLGMSGQVVAAVEGWWQSWDSLLYVSVENGEASVFAAGILNPALVKGDLVNWSPEAARYWIWIIRILSCAIVPVRDGVDGKYRKKGKQWRGRLYDPRSGAWYKSHLSVVDGVLNIRGYIGMPMLGQTRTFERYDPCRVYEDAVMVVWSNVQPPACRIGFSCVRPRSVSPLCRLLVLMDERIAQTANGSYPITLDWMGPQFLPKIADMNVQTSIQR